MKGMNHFNKFTHDKEFNYSLVNLFREIVRSCDPRLLFSANKHPGTVYLSAPKPLLDCLPWAYNETYQQHSPIELDQFVQSSFLRDFKVIPSYEMAITIFDLNYCIIEEPWMIKKVLLVNPRHSKGELYTKHLISICQVIFENTNHSLN